MEINSEAIFADPPAESVLGQDGGIESGLGSSGRRAIPPKLYRIGEVADYSDVSRQTIHNYTTMGLIREARWTRGGHRLYDASVFDRLDLIADLKSRGRSMEDIRWALQSAR